MRGEEETGDNGRGGTDGGTRGGAAEGGGGAGGRHTRLQAHEGDEAGRGGSRRSRRVPVPHGARERRGEGEIIAGKAKALVEGGQSV